MICASAIAAKYLFQHDIGPDTEFIAKKVNMIQDEIKEYEDIQISW